MSKRDITEAQLKRGLRGYRPPKAGPARIITAALKGNEYDHGLSKKRKKKL